MTVDVDKTPVGADNSVFRRGLILGLTLAEISLLIVFVLLLVFGGLLRHLQKQADQAQQWRRQASAAEAQLRKVLASTFQGASDAQLDRWVKEIIASGVSAEENKALKERLGSAESALSRIEKAAGKSDAADEPKVKSGPEKWDSLAEKIEQTAAEMRAGRDAAEAIKHGSDAAAKATLEAKLENEQLKGAVANAQRKLEAAGKGTEKPACWATRDGRPEYIFDVTLSSAGIRIHDRALPLRRAQEASLPLQSIRFDQPLSPQKFRAQTRPLFDWGEARGCRFFVHALDGTGAAEKEVFKQRLRVMEEHFYKFLAN